MASKYQAPRGTFDVLPADARARGRIEAVAAASLRPRRLRADRHAGLRGHRAVRARRRPLDRHRAQGDVHLRGQGRPQHHPATRGHGADLPCLPRARHAQAGAAGEAVLRRAVLPPRAPSGRPLPPVPPDRRRGDRHRLAAGRRRGDHAALRPARRAGRAGRRAAAGQPRLAGRAQRLPGGAEGPSARPRGGALQGRPRADRDQPAARLRRRRRGDARRDGERADDRRAPRGRGRRALRRGARPARGSRDRLRDRPDPGSRPRLLHADDLLLRLRRARRPVGDRRRRPLRRPDRAAGRAADAGGRLGGRDRAHPAGAGRGRGGGGSRRLPRRRRCRPAAAGAGVGERAAPRRLDGRGRPRRARAEGPAQARRPDRRPACADPRGRRLGAAARHAERRAALRSSRRG